MTTFAALDILPDILTGLSELGFETPTPVQSQAIPLILQGKKDLISLAQTGTGKTAAFGIPIIQLTDTSSKQTQSLILCPTRELCIQVNRDLSAIAKHIEGVKILAVYGGASIDQQIKALKKGVHIIVATPGRLLDLIRRRCVHISGITSVVLDEADEMLNMGFQKELNSILAETPENKNTLLFSATMPKGVASIAKKYMKDPQEITVGRRNAGAENVQHIYYMVHASDRYAALKRIVDINPQIYGIIFCRTKLETQEISDKLSKDGYRADPLHGDLSQAQRDQIMKKFRRKNVDILVATDVAARGLDVRDLTHVINFSLPNDIASYTHRTGRTGRAGKKGTAISIIHMREKFKIKEIEKRLKKTFQHQLVPSGHDVCKKQLEHHIDTILNVEVDHKQIDSFIPVIYKKLADLDREELIKKFVLLEFNRTLSYYRNAPDLNAKEKKRSSGPKNPKKDFQKNRPASRRLQYDEEAGFTRFHLNVGKKDGIIPVRLISIINEGTRIRNIAIGKIAISEKSSIMDADSKFTNEIIKAFQNVMINGKPVSITEASRGKPSPGPRNLTRYQLKNLQKNRSKSSGKGAKHMSPKKK